MNCNYRSPEPEMVQHELQECSSLQSVFTSEQALLLSIEYTRVPRSLDSLSVWQKGVKKMKPDSAWRCPWKDKQQLTQTDTEEVLPEHKRTL